MLCSPAGPLVLGESTQSQRPHEGASAVYLPRFAASKELQAVAGAAPWFRPVLGDTTVLETLLLQEREHREMQ